VPLEESRRYRELMKLYPDLLRKHCPGEPTKHSQQQKPQRVIRKVTKGEQSRNDKATIRKAVRPLTAAALDKRLSELFR